MHSPLVRKIALALVVLLVGSVLRSIAFIAAVQVFEWRLGTLINWAAYSASAVLVALVATRDLQAILRVGTLQKASRSALLAGSVYLLYEGLRFVLPFDFREIWQTVVALVIVALIAQVIWILYKGADTLASEFQQLSNSVPAAQSVVIPVAQTPSKPSTFCGSCGAKLATASRFCGSCGAPSVPDRSHPVS